MVVLKTVINLFNLWRRKYSKSYLKNFFFCTRFYVFFDFCRFSSVQKMTVEVPPPQPATPPPSELDFEVDLPKHNITFMNPHQNLFLQTTLGREAAAGVHMHVSTLVAQLASHATPDALQTMLNCVEDIVYKSTLYTKTNITEADHPRIRTAVDKHATKDTNRKSVVQTVQQLHKALGCEGEFAQPYSFLHDTAAVWDLFNHKFDSQQWTRSTVEQKRTHLCQFLEMAGQRDLKNEYYACLQTLLETLPEDEHAPTLDSETVSEFHEDIQKLYTEAIEILKTPDKIQFEHSPDPKQPFRVCMDALVLLYIWGEHPGHTNDRRLLQTWTYKGPDSKPDDNTIVIVDTTVTVQINHLTKKEKNFKPFTLELSQTDPELANLLILWEPVARKFQSGGNIECFLNTKKVTRVHNLPNRTAPFVLFQYDYSSCNSGRGKLGSPLGTLHPKSGNYQGNGFAKQAKAAGKRLGYPDAAAKRLASVNAQRHVNVAATRPVNLASAAEMQSMEANAQRAGSSVRAQTTQYAQDQPNASDWHSTRKRATEDNPRAVQRRRTDSQETLTGISDADLLAIEVDFPDLVSNLEFLDMTGSSPLPSGAKLAFFGLLDNFRIFC
eukprot:COSAG01_NODE_3304_length_6293_cov_31.189054_3_plen_609_part_00